MVLWDAGGAGELRGCGAAAPPAFHATERVTAEQTEAGNWRVTLDVRARKVVVDAAGVETEAPMAERVQIGVFAPGPDGDELGAPLYLQMQRIRSGEQTITVTVPSRPLLGGIDPYHLLDVSELEDDDNIKIPQ